MMDNSFYLDVFSNASVDLFPDNKLSSFKIQLPKTLNFDRTYEMALCEYAIPSNFTAITEGRIILVSSTDSKEEKLAGAQAGVVGENYPPYIDELELLSRMNNVYDPKPTEKLSDKLAKAYETPNLSSTKGTWIYNFPKDKTFFEELSIVNWFNTLFQKETDGQLQNIFGGIMKKRINKTVKTPIGKHSIYIHPHTNGLVLTLRDKDLYIYIQGNIARLLGFTLDDSQWLLLSERGKYEFLNIIPNPDSSRPKFLNIYSSCIDPLITGDTTSPLLRTVPIYKTKHSSENISREVLSRNYITVNVKSLSVLEFEIRDSSGKLANFGFGQVYFRLHFRAKGISEGTSLSLG